MDKKITQSDPEWNIFRDCYKLYERFGEPEENDQYWQELIDAGEEIVKQYNHHFFAVRLVSAVMTALDDKRKIIEGKKSA